MSNLVLSKSQMLTFKAFGISLENMKTDLEWTDIDGELTLVPFSGYNGYIPAMTMGDMLDFLRSKGYIKITFDEKLLKATHVNKKEYSTPIKRDLTECVYDLIIVMLKQKAL